MPPPFAKGGFYGSGQKQKRFPPVVQGSSDPALHGSTLLARKSANITPAWDLLPLVTFCNGKGPSRSSRAARERYSRRGRRALTATAPLSDRRFCGFFSVKADLTGTLYHRGGKMSREEAVWDASFLLVRSAPKECLKSKDFAKYVME